MKLYYMSYIFVVIVEVFNLLLELLDGLRLLVVDPHLSRQVLVLFLKVSSLPSTTYIQVSLLLVNFIPLSLYLLPRPGQLNLYIPQALLKLIDLCNRHLLDLLLLFILGVSSRNYEAVIVTPSSFVQSGEL